MSRIAKAPVTIPNGVEIKLDGNKMTVKGSKGQLSLILNSAVNVDIADKVLHVQWDKENIEVDVCTIGTKASGFFSNLKVNLVGQVSKLGDSPHLQDIVGVIKIMLDSYEAGRIDQLYIVSNEFVNTMTQRPTVEQLLPVVACELDENLSGHWDYIYEPDAKDVLDYLLNRFIESKVYQGLVENNACEQAARMVAMKSASDNAGNLIGELQLIYNKARQAAITQEISEIVAGAAAV